VQRGELLPTNPALERHARGELERPIVLFSPRDQEDLRSALLAGCDEFGYRLFELSIESWHLHWIVQHDDALAAMIGRLKTRMRQRLQRGRIWAEGYWQRELASDAELLQAREYIRRHAGYRLLDSRSGVAWRQTQREVDSAAGAGEDSPGEAGG
jgi:REP element-mobilizing transposase RayT